MVDDLTQVLFSVDGARATLTLNRPEQLNALSPTLIGEAYRVTKWVSEQPDVHSLVVRSNGRAFSAGVDIKSLQDPAYAQAGNIRQFGDNARGLARLWETMPQLVVARVVGYCFTGGLEIALGCDFIICSDEAQFCDTHGKLGFAPSWGLAARLSRRVGVQRAREMSMTARRVSAREAKEIGLVLDAVPVERLDARVDELIEATHAISPYSLAAYKDLYRRAQNSFLDEGVAHEASRPYHLGDRAERLAAVTERLGTGRL